MATIDETTRDFLAILQRGGTHGYWWSTPSKQSIWWPSDAPAAPPNGRSNVYVGVHPVSAIPTTNRYGEPVVPANARSQISHIAAISCLFAEFDAKDFGDDLAAVLNHIEVGLPELGVPPPSVVVASGGGYHCYWLFTDPWILTSDAQRESARRLQAAWVAFVGADDVKDLARVLRVPGTFNYKYDPPRPVQFVTADLDRRYRRDELIALLPRQEDPPAPPAPVLPHRTTDDRLQRWAQAKLVQEATKLAMTPDGQKHAQSLAGARLLGGLIPHNLLSAREIEDTLYAAIASRAKDKKNAVETIRDGIAYGLTAPIELPDFQEPSFDAAGTACCPTHQSPLIPARNGNGWRCSVYGCFWWPGDGYTPPTPPPTPPPAPAAPLLPFGRALALPPEAARIYEQAEPCAQWMDEYVRFAGNVAPTMVPSFHQLAALFLTSAAIARRLVYRFRSGDIYPNVYGLFIAESGYGKTTAYNAMKRVLDAAGLRHLLIPEQQTPETMMSQLSTNVPRTLNDWPAEVQADWIREKAFAAQRVWAVDEASFVFDSLSREYMNGMAGLILQFYDCPSDPPTRETQSGGRVVLKDVSLSFFGSSTPIRMRQHFQNETWWNDGLWGRFALLIPDREPVWVEDATEGAYVPIPSYLVQHLRAMHTMFGTPSAGLEQDEKGRASVVVYGEQPAVHVQLGAGVYHAWQAYRKAIAFDLGASPQLDDQLKASYKRFPTHAFKVAMLLATMDALDANVVIEPRHYARAQQIVEDWRATLHTIWAHEIKIDQQRLAEKVLHKLRTHGQLTARQLQQQLNRSKDEIKDVLDLLQESGLVEAVKVGKATSWQVIV